ncbi:MAG: hypothetical protein RJB24_436 [Candidatus Parcubacteria bacterium]|jgi:hypothetical protein
MGGTNALKEGNLSTQGDKIQATERLRPLLISPRRANRSDLKPYEIYTIQKV